MSVVTTVLQRLGVIAGLEIGQLDSMLLLIHRLPAVEFGKRWHSQPDAGEFERRLTARRAINESYSRLPVAR